MLVGFDVIILIVLLVILSRTVLQRDAPQPEENRHLNSLKISLEKLMCDSEKVSQDMLMSFEEQKNYLKELLSKIEEKERKLRRYIIHADDILKQVNQIKPQEKSVDNDPYKKAAVLVAQGKDPEEVQKQCGLTTSEIDLIVQLNRPKSL